jgi:hypothetical protein
MKHEVRNAEDTKDGKHNAQAPPEYPVPPP